MKIVTAAEMREIDRVTTAKYGVPSLTLMENAGGAVAEFVLKRFPKAKTVGVICGKVKYFASQPWPFPSSLMIGCHARALSEEIVIDREELEDARWFDRTELATMLKRQHKDGLTTPPPVAIAHHIIRDFVENGCNVFG